MSIARVVEQEAMQDRERLDDQERELRRLRALEKAAYEYLDAHTGEGELVALLKMLAALSPNHRRKLTGLGPS